MTFVPTVSSKWAKGSGGPAGDECQNLVAHTLTANGFDASEDGTGRGIPITAFDVKASGRNGFGVGDQSPTLRAMGSKGGNNNGGGQVGLSDGKRVRLLTPKECERLMGWPDDFTRWGYNGKEMADGPRYKMCGNGVVSNVAEWIGRRIMGAA